MVAINTGIGSSDCFFSSSLVTDVDVLDLGTDIGADLSANTTTGDEDDDLGDLVIAESPPDDASITTSTAGSVVNAPSAAADELEGPTDSQVTVDASVTVRDRSRTTTDAVQPPQSPKRGRGRGRLRSVVVVANKSLDGRCAPSPDGAPPSKRSRSQSYSRHSGRRGKCDPMLRPTPPPAQPTKEHQEQAVAAHLANVAEKSKQYIAAHAGHNCFGKRGDTVRDGTCIEVRCVWRGGKMPAQFIRRWGRGRGMGNPDSPNGFFDADSDYYDNPNKLNPPKHGVNEYCDDGYQGPYDGTYLDESKLATTSSTSERAFGANTGPVDDVIDDMDDDLAAGPSGSATAGATDAVDDMDIDTDEENRLLGPPSILRPPRTHEILSQERVTGRGRFKSVRINEGGIVTHVLADMDPRTGRMEDRRSEFTIQKREREAREAAEVAAMSVDEVLAAGAKLEAKAAEREERRRKRRKIYTNRKISALKGNVYCGVGPVVMTGDLYIGDQAVDMAKAAQLMATTLNKLARIRREQRVAKPGGRVIPGDDDGDEDEFDDAEWSDCTDCASELDDSDGGEFAEADEIDPLIDVSLARAEDNKLVNSLYAHASIRAVLTAERMHADKVALDEEIIQKWLRESLPGIGDNDEDTHPVGADGPIAGTDGADGVDQDLTGPLNALDLNDSFNLNLNALSLDDNEPAGDKVTNFSASTGSTFPPSSSASSVIGAVGKGDDDEPIAEPVTDDTVIDADADVLNKSIPWHEYQADPVEGEIDAANVYNEHQVQLTDDDIEMDPHQFAEIGFRFAGSVLSPVETHNLDFAVNKEARLVVYRRNGTVSPILIDQLTQGYVASIIYRLYTVIKSCIFAYTNT